MVVKQQNGNHSREVQPSILHFKDKNSPEPHKFDFWDFAVYICPKGIALTMPNQPSPTMEMQKDQLLNVMELVMNPEKFELDPVSSW